MFTSKKSRIWGIIFFVLTICLINLSAQAKFSGGTGEPNDPYQIATAEDLMLLGETPEDYDKHFILTADIDLDPNLPGRKVFDRAVIAPDTNPSDYASNCQGTPFTGLFDGNGHTVSHLTIAGRDYIGLFGLLESGAEVKNIGVLDANITIWIRSAFCAGVLVGANNGGSITTSCSSGTVRSGSFVGGLVGFNGRGGTVTNCYSTSTVTGSGTIGGLVGLNYGGIVHCYSAGPVSGSGSSVGGCVGAGGHSVISSFWDTETSGQTISYGGTGKTTAEMQTVRTFLLWGTCGNEGIWTIDEGKDYPRLWWEDRPGEPIAIGATLSEVMTGDGTEDSPYLIHTGDELNLVGLFPCDWDKHFKLMADIDLSGYSYDTALIAPDANPLHHYGGFQGTRFTGVFDGNGHTISHLTIVGAGYLGLFGVLASGSEIRDVGVVDVNITGSGNYIGGLVGSGGSSTLPIGGGLVTRCYSTGIVHGGDSCVGGLVGYRRRGEMTDCYSTCVVSGNSSVGGLVGYNSDAVIRCWSTSAVNGDLFVGGLIGDNSGTLTHCYSTGVITGTGGYVGGLVGHNSGSVVRCYSTALVSGKEYVGGLAGRGGNVTHCYSTGAVDGNDTVGGLVGIGGHISSCYSTGKITGNRTVGGLMGRGAPSSIQRSVWDMERSGLSRYVGGVGLSSWEMMDPYMLGLNGFANDPNWILDSGRDYPRLAWEGTVGDTIPEPDVDWLEGTGTEDAPYRIDTADQLILLGKASILWDRCFILGADIDLDPNLPDRRIFTQGAIPAFMGVLDGNDHAISHLTIVGGGYLGLVGQLLGEIRNFGVVDVNITGSGGSVGGMAGSSSEGLITKCHVAGTISGDFCVGGIVGSNGSIVTECHSTGAVKGGSSVGGLVGSNGDTGLLWFGLGTPLVSVDGCYSNAVVSGNWDVGGLVGENCAWVVTSYSTGEVCGSEGAGGLVGSNGGDITQCYTMGAVTGTGQYVGGLVGRGWVGVWDGRVEGGVRISFWDTQTSGQPTSDGGTGRTTAEMQTASTFLDAGWDFVDETENGTEDIWWIDEGRDYPRLWWEAIE